MIVFRNPGLIDLDAVRTLGVSVKLANSFGRFGTGLKFALASILRGGGKVTIYRGLEEHVVGTITKQIRNESFEIVTLDGEPMGITTQLGKDWEPWMVLRELGCNALDEHGEFGDLDAAWRSESPLPIENKTTIVVDWADLDTAYRQRADLFLEGVELWASSKLRILEGPSAHIFYRGIRVRKLDRPTLFKYDLLEQQYLTEDRTLSSMYSADIIIRDAFLSMSEKELIRQAVTAGPNYHENTLDFQNPSWGVKASKPFVDACFEAREARTLTNDSARKTLLRHVRDSAEEESLHGSYKRIVEDALSYAVEQLSHVGIAFKEEQKFVTIDEMPSEGMLSMFEGGRIYIATELLGKPAREIAQELLVRWVDLNIGGAYGMEDAVRLLAPIIVNACPSFKQDEALIREDDLIAMEAKAREASGSAAAM